MDLTLQEVADLLSLSEVTIKKLAEGGDLPSYFLQGEYRFSRSEIEDYLFEKRGEIGEVSALAEGWQRFGLYRAVHHGGVSVDPFSDDKAAILARAVTLIAPKLSACEEVMCDLLLAREKLMPTSLARGIAVPHARDFLVPGTFDLVHVVYLSEPLDWGALDDEPVHTLFFLFACDDKRHLQLLAKLAHLVSDRSAVDFLKTRPQAKELLAFLKEWESSLGKCAV